jgi:uncharacterized protein involved in outer membrane biogenesis
MRTVKILSVLVGGIMVLAGGLFAVWLSINPNDYRERVAAAVKQSTGRDLILGDVHLSVFPRVALVFGPGSLGNRPGAGGREPLLIFDHAAVRVRLIPLLGKRLEVKRVAIDGLNVRVGSEGEGAAGTWVGRVQFELNPDTPPGRLRFEAVNAGGLYNGAGGGPPVHCEISAPVVEADTSGQSVTVPALDAQLNDSHLRGSMALAGEPWMLNFDLTADRIDVRGRFTGQGTVNVKGTAHGNDVNEVLRTLNGHVDANLAGGALEGIDLQYQLGRARALFTHEAVPPLSDPPRTPFDVVKMSAEIVDGVANTTDLTISSAALRMTGQGSANLADQGLDLSMQASILNSQGASVADIPFKVTGTYVDPTVRADVEALAKGQLKQKLQDLLEKNGLKGLFSK